MNGNCSSRNFQGTIFALLNPYQTCKITQVSVLCVNNYYYICVAHMCSVLDCMLFLLYLINVIETRWNFFRKETIKRKKYKENWTHLLISCRPPGTFGNDSMDIFSAGFCRCDSSFRPHTCTPSYSVRSA